MDIIFLLLLLFSNVPNEHYAQFYKDFCSSEASIGNNKLACLSMLDSSVHLEGLLVELDNNQASMLY